MRFLMKKLLGCLAVAAALVPAAALAESRLRPGAFADTYCEARWRGVSNDRAMDLAVDAAIVHGEKPTYVNSYGERQERGIVLGAEWSRELCPDVWG